MTDIELATPNGPLSAIVEVPHTGAPRPGVVVVHDALGVSSDLRATALKLADQGYLAIAPDLFSRGGVRCIPRVMRDMLTRGGPAVDDILAARDHLIADPDCSGQVGVVGFCMGGGFALVVAPRGFGASAPFYPSYLGSYEKLLDGACPVVASLGKRDPLNIGSRRRLAEALDKQGIAHDIKSYPKAGHSFANVLPAQPLMRIAGLGYNDEATADAWRRIFAFFDTHLRANVTD